MAKPWWREMKAEQLTIDNPDAVACLQLTLSFGDYSLFEVAIYDHELYAILFWLQWQAIPSTQQELVNFNTAFPFHSFGSVVIHSATFAEWITLPKNPHELAIRQWAASHCPIEASLCARLHPSIWNDKTVPYQAIQSMEHFAAMQPLLQQSSRTELLNMESSPLLQQLPNNIFACQLRDAIQIHLDGMTYFYDAE